MTKWFNTSGLCKADIHYMLPSLARVPNLERLIAQQGYFIFHAPRQTGKTREMLPLARQLPASRQYTTVMRFVEVGAAMYNTLTDFGFKRLFGTESNFPTQEQAKQANWNYKLSAIYKVGILDFMFDDHQADPNIKHVTICNDY